MGCLPTLELTEALQIQNRQIEQSTITQLQIGPQTKHLRFEACRSTNWSKTIKTISMQYPKITDWTFQLCCLPTNTLEVLGAISHLRHLEVEQMNMTQSACNQLSYAKKLQSLHIFRSGINDQGVNILATNNTNMLSFKLCNGQIGPQGAISISECWKKLINLKIRCFALLNCLENVVELEIAHVQLAQNKNNITVVGVKKLGKLKRLKALDISENIISDEGAHIISYAVPQLLILLANNCKISDIGAIEISKSFKYLNVLKLTDNLIGSRGFYSIGLRLRSLRQLSMTDNPELMKIGTTINKKIISMLPLV